MRMNLFFAQLLVESKPESRKFSDFIWIECNAFPKKVVDESFSVKRAGKELSMVVEKT